MLVCLSSTLKTFAPPHWLGDVVVFALAEVCPNDDTKARCMVCPKDPSVHITIKVDGQQVTSGLISHFTSKVHGFKVRPTWLEKPIVKAGTHGQTSLLEYGNVKLTNEMKLHRIVIFFACNSISRRIFKSPSYKEAHPNDYPKGMSFEQFEKKYMTPFV